MEYNLSKKICNEQKALIGEYEEKINELKEDYRKWGNRKKFQSFYNEYYQSQKSNIEKLRQKNPSRRYCKTLIRK